MTSTPAGWYPTADGTTRWWDGSKWTEHTQPVLSPTQAPQASPVAPAATGRRRNKTSASSESDDRVLFAKGQNGSITFDGDFITIQRKGALARLSVGKGDKRFPVGSVTSVQWKPPGFAVNGFISFSVGGGNERQSRFGSQTYSAVSDENSVIVTKAQAPQFEWIRVAIEGVIAERNRPARTVIHAAHAAAPSASPIEQLKQLAELHAAGVVSDAEFAAKKAELLSRM